MARKGFRNLSDVRRTTFNIDAVPCSFALLQKPLQNHPFCITVFMCDQKPYPIWFLYCSVQCCNMNFPSCLQSSDLSFGDSGGSRFDSPESNKLWNLRVSPIAPLVLTRHHWLYFCVIASRNWKNYGKCHLLSVIIERTVDARKSFPLRLFTAHYFSIKSSTSSAYHRGAILVSKCTDRAGPGVYSDGRKGGEKNGLPNLPRPKPYPSL